MNTNENFENNGNGNGKTYTSGEVTEIVGISSRQLYYWELKGFIKPEEISLGSRRFKKYYMKDIFLLRKVKEYLELGFTLEAIFRKVEPMQIEVENI